MNTKLVKIESIYTINNKINNLELKINKMKFTMYNGFNYEESFVNHKGLADLESEIEYLKQLRKELSNETH
ncbi:MAG: hypothetical protein ACK41T_03715 [Pseudobdellovibrio sp.]